jgi:hypothetical protein
MATISRCDVYDPLLILTAFWSDYFWWVVAPFIALVVAAVLFDSSSGGKDV